MATILEEVIGLAVSIAEELNAVQEDLEHARQRVEIANRANEQMGVDDGDAIALLEAEVVLGNMTAAAVAMKTTLSDTAAKLGEMKGG